MLSQSQGFTLLELLIVIAVIGIIAATLLPNLLGAQKRANDTQAMVCANALGRAAAIYRIDYPKSPATPAAEDLYGDETTDDLYGTHACTELPAGSQVTGEAAPDGQYEFAVEHASGRNVFTITPKGMVTAHQ